MFTLEENTVNVESLIRGLDSRRLAVWNQTQNAWRPIPVALKPVTVARPAWDALVLDAKVVFSAFPLLLKWVQQPENSALWQTLFSQLNGIEHWAAKQDPTLTWGHATVRFDLFWNNDLLKIIEANCTIPAMQAYSDIVHDSWLEATGQLAQTSLGQNSQDLLQSLISLAGRTSNTSEQKHVLILHRPGDSQLAELQHYERVWSKLVVVHRATPDEVQFDGKNINFNGEKIDFVYRHIFAWRLEDHAQWSAALRDSSLVRIYNPVSAHYEVKAFFALLTEVAADPRLSQTVGFSNFQREAILRRLPWTRMVPAPHVPQLSDFGMDGDHFEKQCDKFVVKNSLGYGGHQVFIGTQWFEESTQQRLKDILKSQTIIRPKAFWEWCHTISKDVWIIQERIPGRRHKSRILAADRQVREVDGFVDASVFLNSDPDSPHCGGGVSRFASGPLVNIGAGGGLAPFFVSPA